MPTSRPSRIYVTRVYFKRLIRWRRNSWPYISGDAFADLADYVYKPPKFRSFRKQRIPIQSASTIFCRSEDLEEMLLLYRETISAKVIICGNSDFEFHQLPNNIPVSIKGLFLQNSFISDNKKIYSIPIGIENLRWGVNGNPRLLWKRSKRAQQKVLFGPFGRTHKIREEVANTFSSGDTAWDFLGATRISPLKYAWIARGYQFIAAVRGNGIDTHRHWETLYRGIAPIVMKDAWSESFTESGIPFELINEWSQSEIHRILTKEKYIDLRHLPMLWMPFWADKIETLVNS